MTGVMKIGSKSYDYDRDLPDLFIIAKCLLDEMNQVPEYYKEEIIVNTLKELLKDEYQCGYELGYEYGSEKDSDECEI